MTKLVILEYPDPRLRKRAVPVEKVDDALRQFIGDLLETMYAANGIGLAATQVDVHKRVIAIDVSENRDRPLVLINPEILSKEGEGPGEEGCLSLPGIYEKSGFAPWTVTASRSRWMPKACSGFASSTRWTILKGSCSSTICPSSSAR
jgi:peptide deformylase